MPPSRSKLFVRVGDGTGDGDSKDNNKKRRPKSLTPIEPGVDSDRDDYDDESQDESLIETALEHGYFVLIEHALAYLDQNVGNLSGFLNTTEGRDKLIKVIQYGSRAFIYLQGGTGLISTDFERRLMGFTSSCSIARKFLKLGMQMTLVRMCSRVIRNDIIGRYVDLYNRVYFSRRSRSIVRNCRRSNADNNNNNNNDNYDNGDRKKNGQNRTKDGGGKKKNVNFGNHSNDKNGSSGSGLGSRHNKSAHRSPSFYDQLVSQPFSHKMRRKIWAHIPATLLFLSTKKVWLRLLGIFRMLGLVCYFTCDHFCLAIKTKMLHGGDPVWYMRWLKRALCFHVGSCVCGLLLNTYQYVRNFRRIQHIRKCMEELAKKKTLNADQIEDPEYAHERLRLEHYRNFTLDKMAKIRASTFKLLLDLAASSDIAFDFGFNKGRMAILSTTSALMATEQLWTRIRTGKYNPCYVNVESKPTPRLPRGLEPPKWGSANSTSSNSFRFPPK
eukprot:jgi/Bigna1/70135/fgenesh1_pg.11_\